MHHQPTHGRHEVTVLNLRSERKMEALRLDQLKAIVKSKLEAALRHQPEKPKPFRSLKLTRKTPASRAGKSQMMRISPSAFSTLH